MKYTLRQPCESCPFRTDVKPFLSVARAEEIIDSIVAQQLTFACHKTTIACKGDESFGDRAVGGASQHCAGALILLEKIKHPNQMMRTAERLGFYDRMQLRMDSPVFDEPEDFIDAQSEMVNVMTDEKVWEAERRATEERIGRLMAEFRRAFQKDLDEAKRYVGEAFHAAETQAVKMMFGLVISTVSLGIGIVAIIVSILATK